MEKVLIFGVSGFVGGYLSKEFLDKGYEVYGSDKHKGDMLSEEVIFYEAEVLNRELVEEIVHKVLPDIIVNLAAVSSVGISWGKPQETVQVNVIGALNILEAARRIDKKPKIMLIGSSEEYVMSDFPMNEEVTLNASNPYGISKVTQELFARLYKEQYGLNIYYVRPFNHTGVGQRESFVIPSFCKQAVEIERSGCPGIIKVGNLSVKRDFTHVKDVVRAYRMIVESDNNHIVYNVGSGNVYSLEEILEYIIGLSSQKIDIVVEPSRFRPTEQPFICCDRSLITAELGWEPEYTVFDALAEMYEFYKNN